MRFFIPFLVVLLGAIMLSDWIASANGRAVHRFQERAIQALRDRGANRIEIPAGQLFEDSVAVCVFEAGYHGVAQISMPEELRSVLPVVQKEVEKTSLENWEVFAVSGSNVRRWAFSHAGDIQLSSRSGLGNQCVRPTAMLGLQHSGPDKENLVIDFP